MEILKENYLYRGLRMYLKAKMTAMDNKIPLAPLDNK
jgi:hypothetical protein